MKVKMINNKKLHQIKTILIVDDLQFQGAEVIAQVFRTFADFVEDPCSVPITYIVTYNLL